MPHTITQISENGFAYRHGLRIGDIIIAINGEELIDQIDYQALTALRHVSLSIHKASGCNETIEIIKPEHASLGLKLGNSLICTHRSCHNKCIFCFIDQMPKGMRDTLYVKDDDWRLSLMMGNYITLTNIDDAEFDRILRRKASPLYISVHATDPAVRISMMQNRLAGNLMERLVRLMEAGLRFHCQVVLCPGINDHEVLERTLSDLAGLYPAARTVALVPVGLTRHRENLVRLFPYSKEEALDVLTICSKQQVECLGKFGTRFVFPADEFLCIAGREIPEDIEYEEYAQIENGVGLLRSFEESLKYARNTATIAPAIPRRVLIACGTSVAPFMRAWIKKYSPEGVSVTVKSIANRFFGHHVTVSGLITGCDLIEQLAKTGEDEILICRSMLSESGELFLDGMSLSSVQESLPAPIKAIPNDGNSLYHALLGFQL